MEKPSMSTEAVQTPNRLRRYRKAADLLRRWMQQEDDYDEKVWSVLETELKDTRARCRESDEPAT